MHSVDTDGYVTLYSSVPANIFDAEAGLHRLGAVPRMALPDNNYNMVVDYTLDCIWPYPIAFTDNWAIVQTGATEYTQTACFTTNNAQMGGVNNEAERKTIKSKIGSQADLHKTDTSKL